MPIHVRRCIACRRRYDVMHLGETRVFRLSDGQEPATCPRCNGEEFEHVPNFRVHPIGLGGEAGVGKFFPYYDRGLGVGGDSRGVLVRDAAHRRQLLEYTPTGVRRPEKLIPLDTTTDSGLRGTWDDIADRNAAEAEEDEREYNAYVKEMSEGPNREAYHRVMDHAADTTGGTVAE